MTTLSVNAQEKSTYVITANFKDEAGQDVTPTSATWTLTDEDGTVINSRQAVAISPLAASVDIVLTGADLAVDTGFSGDAQERVFTIEAVYDSSLGTGLTLKAEARFNVDNLIAVT
jgi:hypothetical protein